MAIGLMDSIQDAIIKTAKGNPGALSVCMKLLAAPGGVMNLLHLDDMGIHGASIWIAFKDWAGEDVAKLEAAPNARDIDLVRVIKSMGGEAWTGGQS